MISGPKQLANGDWCVDVEEGYSEDFDHALIRYAGAGATARREGKRYFFPKGMRAAQVTDFWNQWVASSPQYKPRRTGKNPVDQKNYIAAHGDSPAGIRRWRFICRSADGNPVPLKIEADGEYATVLPDVQAMAQRDAGDCTVAVLPTSGPPRRSGVALDEGTLKDWILNQVRPFWINEPR